MDARLSRRRVLALGSGLVVAGVATALGLTGARRCNQNPTAGGASTATPQAGPTPTPSPIATPAPTRPETTSPTPTAMPTAVPATPTPTTSRPQWTLEVLRQPVSSGPADRPLVALTIDDGWSSRDAVLSVLQNKDVHATFFLTGRALVGDSGFIARALAAGCEIGNHTMDHYTLTDKSKAYIQKDLQDFEDLVRSVVPLATTKPYMRPSGGSLNATVIDAAADAGYRPILWSVSAGDGSATTTPDEMTQNVLGGARPGAIILLHFGPRAVVALPGIIDGLRARKLEPVTVTVLFGGAG